MPLIATGAKAPLEFRLQPGQFGAKAPLEFRLQPGQSGATLPQAQKLVLSVVEGTWCSRDCVRPDHDIWLDLVPMYVSYTDSGCFKSDKLWKSGRRRYALS